ncbi:MAG TPA: type I restriction enzyme HsdR N-terminal domain-containing protein [Ferruginibacter sp.]|nr:type I restriction enzyme HsdR N-terminal domain-containing protein [Ferruginibacter sp.]
MLIAIQYPERKPTIRQHSGREEVFCISRKRWVQLTPEEWVRQNFLLYLTDVLHYPLSIIAVEKQIRVGELNKRVDILVYRSAAPHIIVECKEMNVALTENVMNQALRYNIPLRAEFVVITNGQYTAGFQCTNDMFTSIGEIPAYEKSPS